MMSFPIGSAASLAAYISLCGLLGNWRCDTSLLNVRGVIADNAGKANLRIGKNSGTYCRIMQTDLD